MIRLSAPQAALEGWRVADRLLRQVAVYLIAIAAADYAVQKWRFTNSLKMTKDEVKDDAKLTDGNPEIKARVRRVQREMVRRRMMKAVPKATVVITNPTHYAVALEYRRGAMPAPRVVAKGQNLVAQRIKALAREHGVPVVENVAACAGPLQGCRDRRLRAGRSVRGRGRSAGVPDQAEAAGAVARRKGRSTLAEHPVRKKTSVQSLRRPGGGGVGRAADDRAAAAAAARPAAVGRHRPGRRAAADGDLRPRAHRVLGVSVAAPGPDPAAPVAERRLDAPGAAARRGRRGGRRQRDHVVRPVRRRRQLRRRHRRLPRPDRHPVHRHQPRRGPHLRGHREVHPRRAARQADGDRRRPERRADRRARGAGPPRTGSGGKPTSTVRWTAPSGSRSGTRWRRCSSPA